MKTQITLLLLAFFFQKTTNAQQPEPTNFDLATSYIVNQCDFDKVISKGLTFNKWFDEYDKYVTEKALIACRAIYDDNTKIPDVKDYWSADLLSEILQTNLNQLDTAFSLNNAGEFKTLRENLISWQSESALPVSRGVPMPASFNSIQSKFYFLTTPTGLPRPVAEQFILDADQNTYCVNHFDEAKNCVEVFDAFNKINRKLSIFQRLSTIQKHNAYVAIQESKWDKFSDNSRFQSFIDIAFTSWVYRKHFSRADDLITPPPLQLFALRPSFIYEHLPDAPKGDKDKPALALEWIGFNAWDSKVPFGMSLTSVYADRETGKSVGHGLTFHLNNAFSFGFANRGGGDNSLYVNIELMDWFGETQNMLKSYGRFK
ncbi:hypothetical protein [Shewanella baltica]|uniref:hypothetical protein n=1 Tax=Shewanella baltica TaxID=62322 RepID=UPI00217EB664|nr:hypothetical protein [Shewanella baltica]MCS6208149.1 hypothetical protein [Shewanella baltica]